ncbi:MAG TPA: hypothetical protein VEC12_15700 [Bacteroidia bacterium]|nr:hypothetical protein [Bacteroidia bacterium]
MEPGNFDKYKTNPEENFKVPEKYFDTFSSRVKDEIAARKAAPVNGFSWQAFLRPVYTVPVAIVMLVVAGYFILRQPAEVTPGSELVMTDTAVTDDTLTEEAVIDYLAAETDLAELEDELGDEILVYAQQVADPSAVTTLNANYIDEGIPSLTDEEIEEYLLDNFDETIIENL